MSKIFITGSSDGLGLLAAKDLVAAGHEVVLHARNKARGEEALNNVPGAGATLVLIGDLSSIDETKQLAADANALGIFDSIIHNAGVYQTDGKTIFNVNSLAPYILTCLMHKPKRLIYMSSGMHTSGNPDFKDFNTGKITYSTSKLHNVLLTKVIADRWPEVYANAVDPGWVPTKMGGANATGNLQKGFETQIWLATSNDPEAQVSGRYFYHQKERPNLQAADDSGVQNEYLSLCEKETGVGIPD